MFSHVFVSVSDFDRALAQCRPCAPLLRDLQAA